jgi:phosphodiesterase/alkaline phosphatase D-like protein
MLPDTPYVYEVEVAGQTRGALAGEFRTFPAAGSPASFTVAFASCARTGSRHKVFDTIRGHSPLLFLQMGDLHYENIRRSNRDEYVRAYGRVLGSTTQARLYRRAPLAYVWDDHDYGPNNSDAASPSRTAARLTYQDYVPHYPLAAGRGDVPIYHAFSVGRVRFVLTDLRSERAGNSMLGAAQKEWFLKELAESSRSHALVVWVSSVSWTGEPEPGKDRWSGYPQERRDIANFVRSRGVRNLCILSGDAHMLAIDDGRHTDFAEGGGAPIPLFHAAALDGGGSVKTRGRSFTHEPIPGGGHFGLMKVVDRGGAAVTVEWSGRDASDRELMWHSFSTQSLGR